MNLDLELSLLRAVCKYRPVAPFLQFKVHLIAKQVSQDLGQEITEQQILSAIESKYNLSVLEPPIERVDFELPFDEYGDLIEEICKADVDSLATPEEKEEEEEEDPKKKKPRRKSIRKKR
ncbi:hypothetical protein EDD86DRAFT_199725 [Gorgonomyces haynaldii]|nr:hypothetical protein EDD86DRAFT_199725 [Gorgonomyces haynaldii]